jgi:phosphohistidine phosphatase
VVVVGHQPTLGRVIARLLQLGEDECPMKKGALWWLRQRERHGQLQTVIVTVQTPELL